MPLNRWSTLASFHRILSPFSTFCLYSTAVDVDLESVWGSTVLQVFDPRHGELRFNQEKAQGICRPKVADPNVAQTHGCPIANQGYQTKLWS